jgi:hypothetical protein
VRRGLGAGQRQQHRRHHRVDQRPTVDGRAALDAEIAFTQDGFDGRDLLQVVTVDETYVLQLQALGRAEDDNVDELFQRVTNGVQLP